MADIETTQGFLSLADLASMNTDEVSELMSRLPAQGMYTVQGLEIKATASEPKEEGQAPIFNFGFQLEILEARLHSKDEAAQERLVGKKLFDRKAIFARDRDSLLEGIGLIKGDYKKIGLPNEGTMGGNGQVDGWLDGIVGHIFKVRVRHGTSNGVDRAYFDWSGLDKKEQADAEAA